MKFSVCIPNYNYATYLGRAISSLLAQSHQDLEILVSDNVSTDGSVEAVRKFTDPRVKLHVNRANVGFAGNLDRAVAMATGDRLILFPSDDLMGPEALARYDAFYRHLGDAGEEAVVSSTLDQVDLDDRVTGRLGFDGRLWLESDRAPELDEILGGPVYRVKGEVLLGRSLRAMTNPFNLTSTCYPRKLYDLVEGYRGDRIINPDRWFHWRLLGVTREAYFVDRALAACRWHPDNQTFQQARSGALKFLVDEYAMTFQTDKSLLERGGLTRIELERAFVEHDIARHGLATLAKGDRGRAWRVLTFGRAVYPQHVRRSSRAWLLRALLLAGPLGRAVAAAAYKRFARESPRSR